MVIQSPPSGLVVDVEEDQSETEAPTQVRLIPTYCTGRDADDTEVSRARSGTSYGDSMLTPPDAILIDSRNRHWAGCSPMGDLSDY